MAVHLSYPSLKNEFDETFIFHRSLKDGSFQKEINFISASIEVVKDNHYRKLKQNEDSIQTSSCLRTLAYNRIISFLQANYHTSAREYLHFTLRK